MYAKRIFSMHSEIMLCSKSYYNMYINEIKNESFIRTLDDFFISSIFDIIIMFLIHYIIPD